MESEFKLVLPDSRIRGLNHCVFKAACFVELTVVYLYSVYIQTHKLCGKGALFFIVLCPIIGFPIQSLFLEDL